MGAIVKSVSKFDLLACDALHAQDGGNYKPVSLNVFEDEDGRQVQLIERSEAPNWAREILEANSNPAGAEDAKQAISELEQVLIDYDLDDAGNRYSEFFYIANV